MNSTHFLSAFLPLSLCLWFLTYIYSKREMRGLPTLWRWFFSTTIPVLISCFAYKKKSLSLSGLFVSIFVGFVLTLSNYSFMASLLTFFITSSSVTKFRSHIKRRIEEDFREGGQRNWVQVVCNGGVAAQLSFFYLMESGSREVTIDFISEYNISWFAISVLGAICCANGDTWASELGSVIGRGDPRLITTLRRVVRGTNGGVSLVGLLVSALGGCVVSFAFYIPILLFSNSEDYYSSPPQLIPLLIFGLFAGLFGSIVDSLLGATLQYSGFDMKMRRVVQNKGKNVRHISGINLLDNHSVNLLSTFITAVVSPYFAIILWNYF